MNAIDTVRAAFNGEVRDDGSQCPWGHGDQCCGSYPACADAEHPLPPGYVDQRAAALADLEALVQAAEAMLPDYKVHAACPPPGDPDEYGCQYQPLAAALARVKGDTT